MDFLLSSETSTSPLPILGDRDNRERFDPEESSADTGIYRDIWERKSLPPDGYDERLRDVLDSLNWIGVDDWQESAFRASDRKWALFHQGTPSMH